MAEVGRRDPHAIAMVEAALILEASMAEGFDRLVVVTCRPEQRVERWARRLESGSGNGAPRSRSPHGRPAFR